MKDDRVFKVTVTIERRADGGLFIYSEDLPGFVLSHRDAQLALKDVAPALSEFLSQRLERAISVKPIVGLRETSAEDDMNHAEVSGAITKRDYAAVAA